jgi:hypothetical protein
MTRNDIIRMADEAGFRLIDPADYDVAEPIRRLEHFARLIEKHLYYDGIHTCDDECQRPACVAIRKAVQREREACAKVVEEYPHWIGLTAKAEISNAIRARGER